MRECSYCDEGFKSEGSYLEHLQEEHEGELSRIDRRRLEHRDVGENTLGVRYDLLAVGAILAVILFVTFHSGGSSMQTPHDHGTVHYHGTMEVIVDGESLDFNQPQYLERDRHFYFVSQDGASVWHAHSRGITVEYAAHTLGIEIDDGGETVTIGGTTYHAQDPGTDVQITVDDRPVDPHTYELQGVQSPTRAEEGDHVEILVTTNSSV